MNKIILKDFEVKACHGCNPEEKRNPQRFLFTAEIFYDFSQAAKNDDLTKTISYSDVKKTLKSFCENNCFTHFAVDKDGDLYPCIRYMDSSLNGK